MRIGMCDLRCSKHKSSTLVTSHEKWENLVKRFEESDAGGRQMQTLREARPCRSRLMVERGNKGGKEKGKGKASGKD
eukprot:2103225-Amphidinium_carterae.1